MARWRPLPDTLDPDLHRLVELLRRLKDRSGLSLVVLAERTSYSKSAWQRYLNGAKFPPRQAVEALGRVAGADAPRLLALWSIAERNHLDATQRYEVTGQPPEPPDPDHPDAPSDGPSAPTAAAPSAPRPRRPRPALLRLVPVRRRVLAAAAAPALALAALVTTLVYVTAQGGGHGVRVARQTTGPLLGSRALAATASAQPVTRRQTAVEVVQHIPTCGADACQGRDPYTSGCDRLARTVHTAPVDGAELRLRYSDRCGAAWAELHGSDRPLSPFGALVVQSREGVLLAAPAARDHSPMLATTIPAHIRVCVVAHALQVCTGDPETPAPLLLPRRTPPAARLPVNLWGGTPTSSVLG